MRPISFVTQEEQTPLWSFYLGRNSAVAATGFAKAVVSAGIWALYSSFRSGVQIGRAIAELGAVLPPSSGGGSARAAVGMLMPHGPLELLVFFLLWSLGLRCGIAWVLPPRGVPRWPNLARQLRSSALCLLLILPALLFAALLEDYVNPVFADRYLVRTGVGKAKNALHEERVGRPLDAAASAVSRDGKTLALLDQSGRDLLIADAQGRTPERVIARAREGSAMFSPSWSPAGKELAVAVGPFRSSAAEVSGLAVIDLPRREARMVRGGPKGTYLAAAWSPRSEEVAVSIGRVSASGTKTVDLWLCDTGAGRWKQLTHFSSSCRISAVSLAWRPDGGEIAFARLGEPSSDRTSGASATRLRPSRFTLCAICPDGSGLREIASLDSYTPVAWSPDGQWIAYLAPDAGPKDGYGMISVISQDGRPAMANLARADLTSTLSWSPDGQELFYHRLLTCLVGRLPKGDLR